ncbi:MAG TPA: hypothetical protein VMT18_07315 [Planctomycetota bacterium]|nr:hypothetical protein [Planctomycetota bacterium]
MKPLHLAVLLALAPACSSTTAEPEPVAAVTEPAAAEALRFVAQAEWVEETPSSGMRAAQYRLPGAAGEASLVVYHFGRGGGSLEANLERWAGQFEQTDGGDSVARMRRSERRVGEYDVVVVDLAGTYVAETSPGSGERVHEEDWRMLAAVIDTPAGPYYAKLVGPEATVSEHAERFDAFLAALES